MLLFFSVEYFPQDLKTLIMIMFILICIKAYVNKGPFQPHVFKFQFDVFMTFNDVRCEQRPIPAGTCIRMAAHACASSSCVVSENIPHRMHSHTGVKSVRNITIQTPANMRQQKPKVLVQGESKLHVNNLKAENR